MEKNIHGIYATNSEGIVSADTSAVADISGSSASGLMIRSFWSRPDGSIDPVLDYYFIFGKGPTYFTLQFQTLDADFSSEQVAAVKAIVNSIYLQ